MSRLTKAWGGAIRTARVVVMECPDGFGLGCLVLSSSEEPRGRCPRTASDESTNRPANEIRLRHHPICQAKVLRLHAHANLDHSVQSVVRDQLTVTDFSKRLSSGASNFPSPDPPAVRSSVSIPRPASWRSIDVTAGNQRTGPKQREEAEKIEPSHRRSSSD